MSRAKVLLNSAVFRNIEWFLTVFISLAMTPFIIGSLGDRYYGYWILIGTLIGYYNFLDIGLSSSVSRFVSRSLGKEDRSSMNRVVNTAFFLYTAIGALVIVISVILSFFSRNFVKDPTEAELFRKMVLLLGLSTAVGFPMRVFGGILNSFLRYDLSSSAAMIKLLISNGLIFYFLRQGHGIFALTVITFGTNLLEYFLKAVFAKKIFPELSLHPEFFQRDQVRELFGYSGKSIVVELADVLRFKLGAFIIAGFLDISRVTYYSVGERLVGYYLQFVRNCIGGTTPLFSQYEGMGDYSLLRAVFRKVTKISTLISLFVAAVLVVNGGMFIRIWLGDAFSQSYTVMLILIAGHVIASMQSPAIGVLYGTSQHHFYALTNMIEGIMNVCLSIVLVRRYGVFGVAWATTIAMLVVKLFVQPIFVCRAIKLSVSEYMFRQIGVPAVKLAVPLAGFYYLIRPVQSASWLNLVGITALQCAVFIPLMFFGILTKEERTTLLASLQRKSVKQGGADV